jgi:shikimate O-hydroxycinnamoyltransferase
VTGERTETVRATDPGPGPAKWVLTGLDRANLSLVIRGTWVFDGELDPPQLMHSLGRTLALYPHLAGRMSRGEHVELCNAGVPFTVAERRTVTVEELCADPDSAGGFSSPLRLAHARSGRAAPLAVRLTRLQDGWVLGVRVVHACLDGQSFYGMVRNWGRIHSGRPVDTPVLDPSLVPPATTRSRVEVFRAATADGWRKPALLGVVSVLPALALGRLHQRAAPIPFSPAALGRLKQLASRESGQPALTTNEALSAHVTRMCGRLHRIPPGTPRQQVTVADLRGRLAAIPPAFAGNAAYLFVSASFAEGAPLAEIARKTHETLAPLFAPGSPELVRRVVLAQDIMRHRLLMLPYEVTAAFRKRPTVTYVNNFSRLPIYDVDFGAPSRPVTPVRVIPHDLPDPVLIWPAPPAVGGVEVYLTGRNAHAVRRLDPGDPWWAELRSFEPT